MSIVLTTRTPIAPSYVSTYRWYIKLHKAFWQNRDVRDIKKRDLEEYVKWLKTIKKQTKEKLHSNTILKIYQHFLVFLNWLKDQKEIISQLPNFLTDKDLEDQLNPLAMAEPRHNKVWFASDQQREMLEAIEEEDRALITSFLMLHPARPGEARALQVNRIDPVRMSRDISQTFSKDTLIQRRKGRKSKPYKLAIHPEWYEFFLKKVNECHPDAFVFVNSRTGKPYSQIVFGEIWRVLRKTLHLPKHIRLYDATRHSIASQLRNKNIPLDRIASLLGHSSTKMVEEIYADLDLENMRADLAKLSLNPEKVVSLDEKRDNKKAQS